MIGQAAVRIGDTVLRQQQLQRCVVADAVGRAQQRGKFRPLLFQAGLQRIALGLQFVHGAGFALQCGFGLGQHAPGASDLLIGIAQLARRLPALPFQIPPLLGHTLELATQLLQLAFGFLGGLRSQRAGAENGHGQQQRTQRRGQPLRATASVGRIVIPA
ncbi:hypothetical protein D3C71_1405960 [compost metagenome]